MSLCANVTQPIQPCIMFAGKAGQTLFAKIKLSKITCNKTNTIGYLSGVSVIEKCNFIIVLPVYELIKAFLYCNLCSGMISQSVFHSKTFSAPANTFVWQQKLIIRQEHLKIPFQFLTDIADKHSSLFCRSNNYNKKGLWHWSLVFSSLKASSQCQHYKTFLFVIYFETYQARVFAPEKPVQLILLFVDEPTLEGNA